MLRISKWLLWTCAFSCPWFYGWAAIGDTRVAAVDLLLLPLLALVLLHLNRARNNPVFLWAVLYIVAAFCSILSGIQDPMFMAVLMKTIRLAGIFLPAMLVALLPSRSVPIRSLIWAFVAGGAASVSYGIIAFNLQLESGTAVQKYYYDNYSYLRRAGGVFRDSGAYSHLLATWFAAALLALDLSRPIKRIWRAIIFAAVAALTFIGLHASLSRSAMLNVAVVAAVLVLPSNPKQATPVRFAGIGLILTITLIGVMFIGSSPAGVDAASWVPIQRVIETATSLSDGMEALNWSGGGRLTGWARGIAIWSDFPLFGVGYKALLAKYGVYSDNNYVLALVETGVFGAGGLLMLVAACTIGFVRLYAAGVPAARTALALWCGQVVHGLTADTFTFMGSMPMVLILAFYCSRSASILASPASSTLTRGGESSELANCVGVRPLVRPVCDTRGPAQ